MLKFLLTGILQQILGNHRTHDLPQAGLEALRIYEQVSYPVVLIFNQVEKPQPHLFVPRKQKKKVPRLVRMILFTDIPPQNSLWCEISLHDTVTGMSSLKYQCQVLSLF